MNEQIELRHSPYLGEWQVINTQSQTETIDTVVSENRRLVPVEELGQFSQQQTVIFEMQ